MEFKKIIVSLKKQVFDVSMKDLSCTKVIINIFILSFTEILTQYTIYDALEIEKIPARFNALKLGCVANTIAQFPK